MPRFTVTVDVNEDALRYVTTNTTDPLEEVLDYEFTFYGLEVSGINVVEIRQQIDE